MSRISESTSQRASQETPDGIVEGKWSPRSASVNVRELLRATVLRRLSREEQLLLVLWYAERMTPAEIAAVLAITVERVRSLHDRIVSTLQEAVTASA